jgi:hypothetical protein
MALANVGGSNEHPRNCQETEERSPGTSTSMPDSALGPGWWAAGRGAHFCYCTSLQSMTSTPSTAARMAHGPCMAHHGARRIAHVARGAGGWWALGAWDGPPRFSNGNGPCGMFPQRPLEPPWGFIPRSRLSAEWVLLAWCLVAGGWWSPQPAIRN